MIDGVLGASTAQLPVTLGKTQVNYLSHLMTKPTKMAYALSEDRSAWASAQSD